MEGVALLAVALILASCETATAPSPTPPRPDALAITPFVDALKLGETQFLLLMRVDRGTAAVSDALQRYADRGVFGGFSVRPGRAGRCEFRFTWLTRQPTLISYDRRRRTLTFTRLLPAVGSYPGLAGEVKRIVAEHEGTAVPPHRRIDARRVRVGCALRRGDLSLTLAVRGPHHAYAVQRGLNLVNQIFLLLQANYPEYLIESFGFSAE